MIRYCTSVAVIAFLSLIALGEAQTISTCSNFNPNAQGFGGVDCGDTISNKKVVLTDDLKCDRPGETIYLKGENALLDCQGHTIQGISVNDLGKDSILVLEDGASVINCHFLTGHTAIKTEGDGCFTINTVTASYTSRNCITIASTGKVIMNDIITTGANKDGINVEKPSGSRGLTVEINNFESRGDHEEGVSFNYQEGRVVTARLFGSITIESVEANGLQVLCGNDVEVYGDLEILGSARMNGIEILKSERNCPAVVTFKSGSTGRICYNFLKDITDGVRKEGSSEVTCDDNSICNKSCNNWSSSDSNACVK